MRALLKRKAVATSLLLFATQSALARESVLKFRLHEAVRWLDEAWLVVPYELENVGPTPVYVAQHPGPSLVVTCSTGGGSLGGVPGGAWSTDGRLARKYFVRLASGEALFGEKSVQVAAECRSGLKVLGVYQSELGSAWGLNVPRQRFYAEPLVVARPTSKSNP